ncbi:MAG: transporter [Ruminococcaceae bacterium]|nr:transporter [Oscillospiraceae bacterium]
MKRILPTLILFLLFLLTGCIGLDPTSSDDPIFLEFESQTWQLTCFGSKNAVDTQTAEYFSQLVYRETNGAVQVNVRSGSTLSSGGDVPDKADITLFSSLLWSQLDPRFSVLTLPFLFSSASDAADALDKEGGDALAEVLAEYGQQCLGIGSGGFRCPTNSIRSITSPADLRDLRLRVDDYPVLREAYSLWGADCVSLSWPLVYTALRTGTHDGQEMPLEDAHRSSIQEVQSYVTDWTGLYSGLFFCMDAELYDSLSPSLQKIVDDCGEKAIAHQRHLMSESTQSILSQWRKAKITVTTLTPEAAAEFRAAAQPCYDAFAQSVSADLLAAFTD